MTVVKRDGDWRLEKVEDGVYEVTFDHGVEAKVVTSDYDPDIFDERYDVTVPVHEVDSYRDAVSLLANYASSDPSVPMGGTGPFGDSAGTIELEYGADASSDEVGSEIDELPPGGIALVLLLGGGITVYSVEFGLGSLPFLVGFAMIVMGLAIVGWGLSVYRRDGLRAAIAFFTTVGETTESDETGSELTDDEPEKTPPAPQSLRDELYFERADQCCEWCEGRTDQPEVHHIEPRSEGGPNDPSNLVVLCPGCHAKAGPGGISRTKLRSKVRRVTDRTTT